MVVGATAIAFFADAPAFKERRIIGVNHFAEALFHALYGVIFVPHPAEGFQDVFFEVGAGVFLLFKDFENLRIDTFRG